MTGPPPMWGIRLGFRDMAAGAWGRCSSAPVKYRDDRGLERSPLMSGASKGNPNFSHKSDSFSCLIGLVRVFRQLGGLSAEIPTEFARFPVVSWAIKGFNAGPNSPSTDWTGKP